MDELVSRRRKIKKKTLHILSEIRCSNKVPSRHPSQIFLYQSPEREKQREDLWDEGLPG